MKMYSNEYFGKIKFQTKWKPDKEFYVDLLDTVLSISFGDISWYDYDEVTEKFGITLSQDKFNYLWNNFPNIRTGLVDFCAKDFNHRSHRSKKLTDEQKERLEYREGILKHLYSKIPVDLEDDSNHFRADFSTNVDEDVDYLEEVNKFRIAGKSNPEAKWTRIGRSNSTDAAFFDYLWGNVKREKGSIEVRLGLILDSIGRKVYSKKIIDHCAKRGTKRMKRSIVEILVNHHYDAKRQEHYETRGEDEPSAKQIEDILLLFANTDDSNVVDSLINSLSVDNLPWIMPSASKFPWLLRQLQRRIDNEAD